MNTLALLALMGWTEWILVILVLMLFFGASKLPQLARSLGSSVNEFKRGLKDEPSATSATPPVQSDAQKKNGAAH